MAPEFDVTRLGGGGSPQPVAVRNTRLGLTEVAAKEDFNSGIGV
jgi:hypothetical protein